MTDFASPCANIAVAVLAAGQARRFGSDKLMADLDGLPVGAHIGQTLGEMPFGWRFAVCSKSAALMQHFSAVGFDIIENTEPDNGQAHSLHLAVRAANSTSATALLVVLADMPFVTARHIERLLAAGAGTTASTCGGNPMPPALFPRDVWPELLATVGDAGARDVLRRATLISAPAFELRDIDVPSDLHDTQSR
jgi:molybdenum cofactor cytidylyltransferase